MSIVNTLASFIETPAYAAGIFGGGQGGQGGLPGMLMPLALFVVIFYFLILRPQKKKQKAHDEMIASIDKGSWVITAGGFYGRVVKALEDSYILDLAWHSAEPMKVRIAKTSVVAKTSAPKKKKKQEESREATTDVTVEGAEAPEPEAKLEEYNTDNAVPAAGQQTAENSESTNPEIK